MVKLTKHYSQHMYLFVIYGLFILCLLGIFFIFTYHHYEKNTLEEAARDLENMCSSIENSVETQLDSLSSISMNLVYSNAIKANFKEFSTLHSKEEITPGELVVYRSNTENIHDIITAIIGAYQNASAINLYTLDGVCVESGYFHRTTTVNLDEKDWYQETMALNGHKYITAPVVNKELPAKGNNQETRRFISLVRVFLDSSGQPEGIAEVVQDCEKIFSLASQLESQNRESTVYIYNSRQELVYPYQKQGETKEEIFISYTELPQQKAQMIRSQSGEQFLLTWQTIPAYDWTVILAKQKAAVYAPLQNFRFLFILIGIVSILLTLFICFYISRRLTIPLEKLTAATSKITINRVLDESKVNLTSADSQIKELSQLCQSIRSMYEKLRSTTQEALLSHTEETRAKLQATQSLINPHFLYNCLTNMSIMAEEEMNEDIIHMCQALCDYFRYISASGEMIVPLEEEIFYTQRYLECMQLRFCEELEYHLDIAQETKKLYIPKLLLQPFVENMFKYGFQIPAPWIISISSSVEAGFWVLTIEDNGGQLSDEKKEELLNLYHNLDMNQELKSMQIGGMGLKNVYLRLKLLYEDKAIFQIDNSQPRKTIFIAGGPVYWSREEYYEQHPKL